MPVIFFLGVSITLWSGLGALFSAQEEWEDLLEVFATEKMNALVSGTKLIEGQLETLKTSFELSKYPPSRELFDGHVRRLMERDPYIHAVLYIPKTNMPVFAMPRSAAQAVTPQFKEKFTVLNNQIMQQGYESEVILTGLSVFSDGYLPSELQNNQGSMVMVPIGQNGSWGDLLVLFHVRDAVRYILEDWRAVEEMANVRLRLMDAGHATFYDRQVFTHGAHGFWAHEFSVSQEALGGVWAYDWNFSRYSFDGPDYLPGIVILFVGAIFTAGLVLIAWRQHNLSEEVRKEVVHRTNELEQTSRRFRLITDNAYDLISITSTDGIYEYCNSAYQRVLNYNRGDLEGKSMAEFIHEEDVDTFFKALKQVESGRTASEFTFRMKHKSGRNLYLEAVAKGLHDKNWRLTNIVIHSRDVTSRKLYADDLARSEQRFRDFADSSADWLWEVDENLNLTYVSPGIKTTLGYSVDDIIGRSQMDLLFPEGPCSASELLENRLKRHQSYRDMEFWTKVRSGEDVCVRISGVPVFDARQKFMGYRGAATNITAVKHDQERMVKLATTDPLTGLLNRSRFSEELNKMVAMARRRNNTGVLLFIDLDQFKHINDTYGHEAGDAILTGVSEILQHSVRTTDVVARLGGDEFGIIMYDIPMGDAERKVQEIIQQVDQLRVNYKGVQLHVTMSIGMVPFPQEDRSTGDLLMSADMAMYRAKAMGRNRIYVDSDGSAEEDSTVKEQLHWADLLRKGLETGDFHMFYQPLVPAKVQEVPLFEALIRLKDENGNFGSPMLFITAAEHFGLIQKLDLSVIDRCFRTQKEYERKGKDISLSLNLSSRSIGDSQVTDAIRHLIKDYRLNPQRFVFEVTETAAIHDPAAHRSIDKVKEFMDELRGMGFRFALDDFGVGFSSFNYIRALHVDSLKIDGSYVKNLAHDHDDQLFVKAITDLAKGMGIRTVAEFVENEEILKYLKKTGVDYAQGYHLSRPEGDLDMLYDKFAGKCMDDFMTKAKTRVQSKRTKKDS